MLENEGEAHEDDKQEAKVGFQTIALQLVLYLPLLYLLPSYADVIINTIVMMNLIANNPSFRSMIAGVVRKNNPTLHRRSAVRKTLVKIYGEYDNEKSARRSIRTSIRVLQRVRRLSSSKMD